MRATRLFDLVTHSAEETVELGRKLAGELRPPCLVVLCGELGTGKTTLTKGIVAGLGVASEEEVTSPSFTLIHEYGRESKVFHVDLYRIEDAHDLGTLGLEDLLGQQATVLVEWGEKLGENAATPRVEIHFEHMGEDERRIAVARLEA